MVRHSAPAEDEPILGGLHICRPEPLLIPPNGSVGLRLMSDLHIGAAHVDYSLIKKEIADAVEKNDRIAVNGDVLDLILPKDHKRYSPTALHPRVADRSDVVNASVDWAVEILSPAAHLINMIGVGNHETAVEKYHATDVTRLLIDKLEAIAMKRGPMHVIHYGGYTGFIDYRLRSSVRDKGGYRFVVYYHHGSGGNAPVTRGLIDFNRKDTWVDADLIWMGHKHQRLTVAVEKIRCPLQGDEPDVRDVRHVMTGAYFKTYCGQSQASVRQHGRRSNYAADAGLGPGGKGGARVELRVNHYVTERPTITVIQ